MSRGNARERELRERCDDTRRYRAGVDATAWLSVSAPVLRWGVVLGLLLVAVGAFAESGAAKRAPAHKRLPLPEMVTHAEKKLDGMRAGLSASFRDLEAARKSQDIQRLGCVNEALTAVKGLVRLGEQNYMNLREAAARGDADDAEHEFVKLSLAYAKVQELTTQLQACSGPVVSTETEGETELEVLPDADLPPPGEDPLIWYGTTEVILSVPDSSSPFI